MGLQGFVVMMGDGVPFYANISGTTLDADPGFVTSFLAVIQAIAKQLAVSPGIEIKEMLLNDRKVLYRDFEHATFIGLFDPHDRLNKTEPIMEIIISTFLALYRDQLQSDKAFVPSIFFGFDDVVEKWRNASEREVLRWAEHAFTSALHGILNKMVNFFPITDLVKINHKVLKNVGRHMIWISRDLSADEEAAIHAELKKRTDRVYGPGMLEAIEQDVKEIMSKYNVNAYTRAITD